MRVYPRVCGGNVPPLPTSPAGKGLSPRVRGKRSSCASLLYGARSIPACAGETSVKQFDVGGNGVYPRVCGGNKSQPPRKTFA